MQEACDKHNKVWFMIISLWNVFLDGLKILWDLKIFWESPFRKVKFWEILTHSVRYGMYDSLPTKNIHIQPNEPIMKSIYQYANTKLIGEC